MFFGVCKAQLRLCVEFWLFSQKSAFHEQFLNFKELKAHIFFIRSWKFENVQLKLIFFVSLSFLTRFFLSVVYIYIYIYISVLISDENFAYLGCVIFWIIKLVVLIFPFGTVICDF